MSRRVEDILPGWPAGLAPTFENVLRLVTREHPTLPKKSREIIARETVAVIAANVSEEEMLGGEVEEEAIVAPDGPEAPFGRMCVFPVADDSSAVRIVYERVVPRVRCHQEAFSVASAFVVAARAPDPPLSMW